MIILDTNVISEIAKRDIYPGVKAWIDRQVLGTLCTTAISLAEALQGIEILPEGKRKADLRADMELVFGLQFSGRILPFDETAARSYGRIVATARAKGLSILIADGQIAAIAQSHHFSVATRDTGPFEAAGVAVINPWMM